MTDEEWFEFCTNCHSMDYQHPSGTRICLDQIHNVVFFVPSYNECEQETCPKLNIDKS